MTGLGCPKGALSHVAEEKLRLWEGTRGVWPQVGKAGCPSGLVRRVASRRPGCGGRCATGAVYADAAVPPVHCRSPSTEWGVSACPAVLPVPKHPTTG